MNKDFQRDYCNDITHEGWLFLKNNPHLLLYYSFSVLNGERKCGGLIFASKTDPDYLHNLYSWAAAYELK